MSFQAKIDELRAQKQQLLDKAQGLADEGKLEELGEITDQMEGINNSIKSLERLMSSQGEVSKLVYDGALHSGNKETKAKEEQEARPFASLGEQLKAVYNLRRNGVQDQRLIQVNNAVLGSNEGTGADGGFAVQTDFAGVILESALERNSLLQRLDRYTVSSGANSMRWVMADETDISKSVFGGVQMYWAAEGGTVPATHPKLREVKLDLEKMMGLAYCTEEMMEDAAFMSGFFSTAFSLAADELLTGSVIGGDGVGQASGHPEQLRTGHRGQGDQPGGRDLCGKQCGEDAGPGHAQKPGSPGVADAPRHGGAAARPVHHQQRRQREQIPVGPRGGNPQL